ncbi:MAG: Tripartite tricarboxylate transporter TctA family protein [Methanoregula sp. PtaU1.Bin051]|nr:MAG: Tripartite tricarboxylate transporter TctA family protein [Methanoregula sp. PtaU1.Bin051]
MIEILIGTLLGVVLGTVSGILPGIHANTLAGVLISLQVVLLAAIGPLALGVALFAALITHTFVDSIPSTFLGIPDADTALAVLPAHALCLEGNGEEAVRIAALGSACAIVLAVPLSILCYLILPAIQPALDWGIGLLIVAVIGYMIVTSEAPGWALAIFTCSGILGIFTFSYGYLGWHSISGESALLMPLLSGLFGISVLATASQGRVPAQKYQGISLESKSVAKGSVIGTAAGIAVGWLPGLSNATANGVLASVIGYTKERRMYILATSAANTANAFIGLAALFALSRMRNGVMVALSSIPMPSPTGLFVAGVLAACAAYVITIGLSTSAQRLSGVDSKWLNRAVIVFVVAISMILTGPFGMFILLLAALLGLVPPLVNVPRMYCMGAIMVPVILYSFGIAGA